MPSNDQKVATADTAPKNRGGRPRNPVDTSSQAFQDAVNAAAQAAVKTALPAILAQIAGARGSSVDGLSSGDTDLASRLAVAIGEMNDSQHNRKRMSPEEIRRRGDARERLMKLIVLVQTGKMEVPHYRVVAKTYLTDYIVEPFTNNEVTKAAEPTEVDWTGIPNEALAPINESAQQVFGAFLESIGGPTDLTSNADKRDMGITVGGLVVRGMRESQKRQVSTMPEGSTTDVRGIRDQNDPRAKKINVLGTIHDPAIASAGAPKFQGELSRAS